MATKSNARTESEGLKPAETKNKDDEMIRCIVRDVWGSKSQKYWVKDDKAPGGERAVRYPIGQWTELPRREIKKLRRVIRNRPKKFNPELGIQEYFEEGVEEFQRFTVEIEI